MTVIGVPALRDRRRPDAEHAVVGRAALAVAVGEEQDLVARAWARRRRSRRWPGRLFDPERPVGRARAREREPVDAGHEVALVGLRPACPARLLRSPAGAPRRRCAASSCQPACRPSRSPRRRTSVTRVVGTSVELGPSTRTVTVTAAAAEPDEGAAATASAARQMSAQTTAIARAARRTSGVNAMHDRPTPFHEGLCGRAVGAGLLASGPILPRLPGSRWRASGVRPNGTRAADFPGHSGGSAPESHRLPMPPTDDGAIVALCHTHRSGHDRQPDPHLHALGDGGETHLGDRSRVRKDDPRIEAYGSVDELGAHLGVALTLPGLPARTARWLRRIQNDLFDVGADLAVPPDRTRASACASSRSRSPGSRRAATRSTRSSSRCARSCCRAGRRRRRGCTSAAPSAGAPSAASSRSATHASAEALPLPQPPQRPALHPRARRQRRRRAALGAGRNR